MSLAALIIRTIYGRQDPATPPPRPPAVSDAPKAPAPAPVSQPARPEPAQARTEPYAGDFNPHYEGPTDTPPKGTHTRWHGDEAEGLALLAELTTRRNPWAAAQHGLEHLMSTPEPPELYPALIGVFCDDCGTRVERDYLVSDDDGPKARFEYARAELRREGWECDQTGDRCPNCIGSEGK